MAAFRFPPILGLGRGGSLRHQRQEPLIVLIESAGDEHFERDVPARRRLGGNRRWGMTRMLSSMASAPIAGPRITVLDGRGEQPAASTAGCLLFRVLAVSLSSGLQVIRHTF